MTFAQKIIEAEKHLRASDPLLKVVIGKYQSCTIKPHTDHYGELVSSIASQQLSVKAAATIWGRVLANFDNKTPKPEQVIQTDTEVLRSCGLSYQKVSYMKDLAQHIVDGRLDMEHISKLPNEELITQLTAVKGIGVWSAHMFMIFSLGRLDVLPIGDLGVRKAAMVLYKLPKLPEAKELENLSKKNKWHPYESIASWYLWKTLDNKQP
jgi:DNA-3-methyladenine glycosylase II